MPYKIVVVCYVVRRESFAKLSWIAIICLGVRSDGTGIRILCPETISQRAPVRYFKGDGKGVLRHNREDAWQKGVARNDPMIIKTQYSGSPLIK